MDDKRSNDASAVMVRADGKVMEKSQLYTSELRIRKPRREMEAAGGKKKKNKNGQTKGRSTARVSQMDGEGRRKEGRQRVRVHE